ncbi:RadC family protein [Chitinophaga defluvii]|uniref:DNA repair protein RadC n=1 Tax=Chitinophaga defluvii TaxID=3163343 RepID=A0ABV2TBB3_9BACT
MSVNVNPTPHTAIKDWAVDDKPREKLMHKGATTLSTAELLAILLNNGHKNKSALDLAQEVLRKAKDNLGELGKLNVNQLKKIRGIGDAKAVAIVAALELARRKQAGYMEKKQLIRKGSDAALFFKPLLGDQSHETFHVLYLTRASRVINYRCVSSGGVAFTIADPKIIFREALELNAGRLLLCHNHPSGTLHPSHSDIRLTQKLKEAGSLFDIDVMDHIIVSEGGYYSMVEEGIM